MKGAEVCSLIGSQLPSGARFVFKGFPTKSMPFLFPWPLGIWGLVWIEIDVPMYMGDPFAQKLHLCEGLHL